MAFGIGAVALVNEVTLGLEHVHTPFVDFFNILFVNIKRL